MRIRDQAQLQELLRLRAGGKAPSSLLQLLANTGALIRGHFRLQSGLHSKYFARVGQLLYQPSDAKLVAKLMTPRLSLSVPSENLVCLSSDNSSAYLGRAVAEVLGARMAITKVNQQRRPVAELSQGTLTSTDNVLIVTDVVTTGSSIDPLLALARQQDATLVGVSALLVLSSLHFTQLLTKHDLPGDAYLEAGWQPEESKTCTQCRQGEPLLAGFEFN